MAAKGHEGFLRALRLIPASVCLDSTTIIRNQKDILHGQGSLGKPGSSSSSSRAAAVLIREDQPTEHYREREFSEDDDQGGGAGGGVAVYMS